MSTTGPVTFASLVRVGAAMAVAGAGLIHLDAVGDHTTHPHVAGFFILLGAAQLAAAGLLVARPSRQLQSALAVGTVGIILLWVTARTTGVPVIPDVGSAEPVGLADAMATALEALALVG